MNDIEPKDLILIVIGWFLEKLLDITYKLLTEVRKQQKKKPKPKRKRRK